MTPPAREHLAPADAADTLVWAVERLAAIVNHEFNPVQARSEAREALGAETSFDPGALLRALETACAGTRLTATPLTLASTELSHRELPFPLITSTWSDRGPQWLILIERHAGGFRAQTSSAREHWVSVADLTSMVADSAQWLHIVPATPMERLSAASHSAQAVLGGDDGGDESIRLKPWDRLRALLTLERDDVLVVFIYSAAVGVLSLATPIAVQSLVGTVAFGTLLQPIVVVAMLFLMALGFQAALNALQARVIELLQQRIFARVALDVAYRLPRVQRDEHHPVTPELVNRFFDVMTVQKSFASVLTEGLSAFMQISIGLLVLAFYHPALLALDLVIVIATMLMVLVPIRRGVRTAFDESHMKYEVGAWLEELARAPAAFRGSGGAALASARADALTREYLAARRRHFSVVFGQTLSAFTIQVVASAVLLGFGGYLVISQSLTLGQLIAAELIVAAVTLSITKFGKILDSAYDLVVGLSKVGHLIDLEIRTSQSSETLPGTGAASVRVEGIVIGDAPARFEVKAGARVALVGAQGTHLGELLTAIRAPAQGLVEVQGVDVRRAQSCALHDQVFLVRSDDLFMGTVYENVSLGRPGLTPSEVRAAVERVGLDDDIRALPQGYDTVLGAQGPFNSGQALRLVVARALAANPRLIVVDDTLDSLDPVSRARTVTALTRRDAPWTLIALVNDPASALARACADVRDVASLTAPAEEAAQ